MTFQFQPLRLTTLLSLALVCFTAALAHAQQPTRPFTFERPMHNFASQGLNQENCINISLLNNTDKPRKMTELMTEDDEHYKITSPSQSMLPITLPAYSTMYVAVCFTATAQGAYHSKLYAIFDRDTATLELIGEGMGDAPMPPMGMAPVKSYQNDLKVSNLFTLGKVKKIRLSKANKKDLPPNKIYVSLASQSAVTVLLTNSLGSTVRKYFDNEGKAAGEYEFEFDGKDTFDQPLPAGNYYVRAEIKDLTTQRVYVMTKKIAVKK